MCVTYELFAGNAGPFPSLSTWSQESGALKRPAGGSVMAGGKKVVLGAVPRPPGSEQVSGYEPAVLGSFGGKSTFIGVCGLVLPDSASEWGLSERGKGMSRRGRIVSARRRVSLIKTRSLRRHLFPLHGEQPSPFCTAWE